jgi:hypothetical protein
MKMSNSNITEPIISQSRDYPILKKYCCPYCKRFLFKGNVKKLNMLCHHCQELIIMDVNKVVLKKTDEI